MPKIKNRLAETFLTPGNKKRIPVLLEGIKNYRPYDPGQYLYNIALGFSPKEKFTPKFIEVVYTTLIAWNMHQRGARLSEFNAFSNCLIQNETAIRSLEGYRMEKVKDASDVICELRNLFDNLELVADDRPRLVTFSKTMHFFLPNLLMPLDRRYTLKYFYNNHTIPTGPKGNDKQFIMYGDVFQQFIELSQAYDFEKHKEGRWNRNVPKIIDNLLISYIKESGLE